MTAELVTPWTICVVPASLFVAALVTRWVPLALGFALYWPVFLVLLAVQAS